MKLVSVVLPVLFALAAQQPAPSRPPMKMGLWEGTSITTISMQGTTMPGGSRPATLRSCVTPETYAEAFQINGMQRSCTRSNEKLTANSYSFDLVCTGQAKGTGHFEMLFDSPVAAHGKLKTDMSDGEHHMAMNIDVNSHWVSADCGNVAPGKAVMVR